MFSKLINCKKRKLTCSTGIIWIVRRNRNKKKAPGNQELLTYLRTYPFKDGNMVRISTLDLNNVKTALSHRAAILKDSLRDGEAPVNAGTDESPFGEGVKMVRKITQKQRPLTPAEKDEVVTKYKVGMTMVAIADDYGCNYTTVGRLLRRRGVAIRE
jgi:hypothetical protein